MSFKSLVKNYFTFNKKERHAVFYLLVIITIILFYLSLSDLFYDNEKLDISRFDDEIAALEAEQEDNFSYADHVINEDSAQSQLIIPSSKQETTSAGNIYSRSKSKTQDLLIELNSADTTQLKKLKGIGSAFAKRIIKYREMLGGYILKEQLLEVYGLEKERYELIASHVYIDSALIRKINVNTSSAEEMKNHPYLKWKLANVIYNYRKNHGNYFSLESIKKTEAINDSVYAKIAPYLSF